MKLIGATTTTTTNKKEYDNNGQLGVWNGTKAFGFLHAIKKTKEEAQSIYDRVEAGDRWRIRPMISERTGYRYYQVYFDDLSIIANYTPAKGLKPTAITRAKKAGKLTLSLNGSITLSEKEADEGY